MKQGNCGVLLVEGVGYGVWEVHVQTISISVCADVEVTKPSGPFFVILILSSCESVIFSSYRFCPFLWVRGVVNGPSAMTTSSVLWRDTYLPPMVLSWYSWNWPLTNLSTRLDFPTADSPVRRQRGERRGRRRRQRGGRRKGKREEGDMNEGVIMLRKLV